MVFAGFDSYEDWQSANQGGRRSGLLSRGKNRGYHREGGKIVGPTKGGSILVHMVTNNAEREGTTAIVRKYRQFVRTADTLWADYSVMDSTCNW